MKSPFGKAYLEGEPLVSGRVITNVGAGALLNLKPFPTNFIWNHQDVFGSDIYMGWICPFVRLVKFVKHQPWESTLTTFSMASVEMASVDQGNVPCRLWTNETHQTVLARRNSSRSLIFFKHRKNRSVILEVHIVTIFCYTNGGNQPKLEPANPLR